MSTEDPLASLTHMLATWLLRWLLACSSCEQASSRLCVSRPSGVMGLASGEIMVKFGADLAPQKVCGSPQNPSMSPKQPHPWPLSDLL